MPFTNYTIENGLPQSVVYTILQDSKGYLWAGTQGGVSCFDGRKFTTWDAQAGLPDNHVTALAEAEDGNTWTGHRYGALACIRKNKPVLFKHRQFKGAGAINQLYWQRHQLWVASADSGLYRIRFTAADTVISRFAPGGSFAANIYQLISKDSTMLYAATGKGLFLVNGNTGQSVLAGQAAFLKDAVYSVCMTADGWLWCGAQSGLYRYNPVSGESQKLTVFDATARQIYHVRTDSRKNVWLTTNKGVVRIHDGIATIITKQNGLLSDDVYDVLEDREGTLWFCQNDGLSNYKEQQFILYTKEDGLVYNEVYSITEGRKGEYWVATAQGVSVFTPGGSKPVFTSLTTKDGLPGNFIYKIFRDSRDNIWIGSIDNGAAFYSLRTKTLTRIGRDNGLHGKEIVGFSEDRKGRIWLTSLDSGMAVYDPVSKKIRNYSPANGGPAKSVWTAYKDRDGELWFGTDGNGLYKLDATTDQPIKVAGQEQLINQNFGSISGDAQGNIWIGSIGGAVFKYDHKQFTQYGSRQGISSNNPYFIFADRRNQVWIGTNTGIDLFDPAKAKATSYGRKDGFLGIETNQNAVYQDSAGDVWIGTVNGLMRCRITNDTHALPPPLVHIIKQRLFLDDTLLQEGVRLAYKNNHITFDCAGVSLAYADKVRYKYMLEGFDKKWSPAVTESYITYTNLPPGKYVFKVMAGYLDGSWTITPTTFSFEIKAPLWQRDWFLILITLLLASAVYALYRYRINQLLQMQKVRQHIAQDLHDDIGATLSSISIMANLAKEQTVNPAMQEKYMQKIVDDTKYVQETLGDIVWSINPRNDKLEIILARMQRYASELLEAKSIDYKFDIKGEEHINDIKLDMEARQHFYMLFKEAVNNLAKYAAASEAVFLFHITPKKILVSISDNGKGFDNTQPATGNGIRNMQERAKQLQAVFTLTASPGKGTRIELDIPV